MTGSLMDTDLSGRVALVTGAGRGNGAAIAKTLADQGAAVAVNDKDPEPASETVQSIEAAGGAAVAVPGDITEAAAVEDLTTSARQALGTIDVLVNNAGVGAAGPYLDKENNDRFRSNLAVHLWGSINCIDHVVDDMVEQGYGKIINITSIHTKNGVGMSPEYDVGKFSLLGLTKSLALELAREGVRVNAVAPGWVSTRMTDGFTERTVEQILESNPMGSFADPQDVANAVTFLATPAADYVNGHEFRVDGGQVPIDSWKYDAR